VRVARSSCSTRSTPGEWAASAWGP
jgi:hypothetical protein